MNAWLVVTMLAATPIRLEEVREQSFRNVAALQAELDALRADQQVRFSRGALLPQLTLNAGVGGQLTSPVHTVQLVPNQDFTTFVRQDVRIRSSQNATFDANLALTQVLYDASRWALLAQNGSLANAAKEQQSEQRMASVVEGVRRFYNLYLQQRTLEVLEQNVKGSQTQLSRSESLFEAGRRRKDDVLAAAVNLGNDRISAIKQRSALAVARADLATWLARPGEEELDAVNPGTLSMAPAEAPTADAAIKLAYERRPLLRALNDQIEAAQHTLEAQRAGYIPLITASATLDRNAPKASLFFSNIGQQNTLTGGLNLSWNLFAGLATTAAVKDAQYAQSRLQLTLEQSAREMAGEVTKATRTLGVQIEAAQVAGANRDVAAQSLHLSEERFSAGASTTLEVRDAQVKLVNAELTWLQSRIDVEVARAVLERDTGTLSVGVTP